MFDPQIAKLRNFLLLITQPFMKKRKHGISSPFEFQTSQDRLNKLDRINSNLDQLGDGLRVGVGDGGHVLGPPIDAVGDDGALLGAKVLLLVNVRKNKSGQLAARVAAQVLAVGGCRYFVRID